MSDKSSRPSSIPWPPMLLIAAIACAWMLGRVAPLAWPGVDDSAARAVGLGIGVAGLVLMTWAAVTLVRADTALRPDRAATQLVTSGPFVRFRNPIYLADTMILLGLAEVTKNIWFAILAIIPEERHLEARFGDAYRSYKERSRRWI